MELKVWCEGIQRVICGVTESTTCQDVVIALAQAMGKTGRYTLVEKWRENERFIAPDESPVVALSKWGEYANDVQFILRNSGSRLKSQTNKPGADTKRIIKLSPRMTEPRLSSSSSLKKSLTFSGAHSHSSIVPGNEIRTRKRDNIASLNNNSSLESLTENSSQISQSSRSTFMHSSPYSSIENARRTRLPDSLSSQSSVSSLVNKHSSYNSHQGFSHHGNVPFSYTGVTTFGSLERTRKRDPSRYNHVHQLSDTSTPSAGSSPPVSTRNHTGPSPPSVSNRLCPSQDQLRPTRDRTSPLTRALKPIPRESNNNIDFKINANLADHKSHVDGLSSREHSLDLTDEIKKKAEIMKLVNLQLGKIEKQEEEINKLESEISSCQHFDHDIKDDTNRISREISRLEKCDREYDEEIQDLELVSWDGKLELEVEKEVRMKAELNMTKHKLASCREEMEKLNNKLKDLNQQMTKYKEQMTANDRKEKEQELKVITEISDLQKQINGHLVKHDEQQKSIDNFQKDVKKFESEILDRKTQVAELEKNLKETNMDSFSRTPSDWLRGSQEGQSLFSRVSPTRPGSARRLDSPQKLKEAIATSKNPHGLWV